MREIVFSVAFLHETLLDVCVYTNGVKITKAKNIFSVFIIEAFIMLSLLDEYTGYCNNLKWLHCKHTNNFVLCWYIALCSIVADGCSNWCDREIVCCGLPFAIFGAAIYTGAVRVMQWGEKWIFLFLVEAMA